MPERSSAWYPEARALREQGMKVKDIAAKLGRTKGAVESAVKGIKCPVDHNKAYYQRTGDWHDEARRLRLERMTIKQIAKQLRVDKEAVSRVVADIPIDLRYSTVMRGRPRPADVTARIVATRKANHVPKPKTSKPRVYRARKYVVPAAEQRRRQIHNVITRDQRAPATITLPRVSLLDFE